MDALNRLLNMLLNPGTDRQYFLEGKPLSDCDRAVQSIFVARMYVVTCSF